MFSDAQVCLFKTWSHDVETVEQALALSWVEHDVFNLGLILGVLTAGVLIDLFHEKV